MDHTVTPPGKLAGRKVALVGKIGYNDSERADLEATAQDEGATLVDGLKIGPDVLVEGFGAGGKPSVAAAKVRAKHPGAQVVDVRGFYDLVALGADDVRAILRGPPRDYAFWYRLLKRNAGALEPFNLSGSDFCGLELHNAFFLDGVNLDSCDFTGATLRDVSFGAIKETMFNGAKVFGGVFGAHRLVADCVARNVVLDGADWGGARFERCDFSGAKLAARPATGTRFSACNLRGADLSGLYLLGVSFLNCDLTGAVLRGSNFGRGDFSGSNLAGADCTDTDFSGTSLAGADLRGTNLRGALFTGSRFVGAQMAGADFTGASVRGATLEDPVTFAGTDTAGAVGFVSQPLRTPGPKALAFEAAAIRARTVETSIVVDLGADGFVTLTATLTIIGTQRHVVGRYSRSVPLARVPDPGYVDAPSTAQAVVNLAEYWRNGRPRPESVTVGVKKPPASAALPDLARAAWCEAFGIEV